MYLAVRVCGLLVHNTRKRCKISFYGHTVKVFHMPCDLPAMLLVAYIKAGLMSVCVFVCVCVCVCVCACPCVA